MTRRQQRRAQKKVQTQTTPKPTNKMSEIIKYAQLEKISGYMKGILKVKQEQEERELMWNLIKKYEDEVWRAFTPYA
jgi:hypothetical protein